MGPACSHTYGPCGELAISIRLKGRHMVTELLSFLQTKGGVLQTAGVYRVAGRPGRNRWDPGATAEIWPDHKLSASHGNLHLYPVHRPEGLGFFITIWTGNRTEYKQSDTWAGVHQPPLASLTFHCSTRKPGGTWTSLRWCMWAVECFLTSGGHYALTHLST